jgi:hypothetical protein
MDSSLEVCTGLSRAQLESHSGLRGREVIEERKAETVAVSLVKVTSLSKSMYRWGTIPHCHWELWGKRTQGC